ncbi:hypothetical protein M8C21_024972 [Ambrosia artemisiifolia]|uniref:Uncharacterized protein n=1 Tax=Ambrosia artemisiifolia TaxID=4212 RepID=A0AAD5C2R2_AMBAR|nr:hypothetical protein M8C21_024972 [Ambrosia artemisiifolia]
MSTPTPESIETFMSITDASESSLYKNSLWINRNIPTRYVSIKRVWISPRLGNELAEFDGAFSHATLKKFCHHDLKVENTMLDGSHVDVENLMFAKLLIATWQGR